MRALNINFLDIFNATLLTHTEIIQRVATNSGGLKITPVQLICNTDAKSIHSRPIPYRLRQAVEDKLNGLCRGKILEKVSHSRWATLIVVVKKPNGSERICGDYLFTVNSELHQVACITTEPEDFFPVLKVVNISPRWISRTYSYKFLCM